MTAFRELVSALAYFTVIPLGRFAAGPAPDARALSYLPFVGIVVGALAGAGGWLVSLVAPSSHWPAIVAFALTIALTGAIHVDGFLDCCDGLLVTASVERRLEILHDPRHGTFAVCGMAILSVVWLAALDRIAPPLLVPMLAFSGGLSRLAVLPNAFMFPYARGGSRALAFELRPRVLVLMLATVAIIAIAWFSAPVVALLVLPAIALALGLGLLASQRLAGGLTGDVYGAIVVIVDVLALVAISMMLKGAVNFAG